jgi:2-oxoglutarate dehydrogenase E1 component
MNDRAPVKRIVLCSGKVFYDLNEARKKSGADQVALIRLEQFYPFPQIRLQEIISSFPNASELIWCQEEPKNMGGWTFVEPRLEDQLPGQTRPRYVGRAASASPATGSYAIYLLEQARLILEALTIA